MTKTKRGFKACVIALLFVLLMLALIPATIAKAETLGDGIDVSSKERTGYYLTMNMVNRDTWIKDNNIITASPWGEFGGTTRYTLPATLVIVFESARYEDRRAMIFANTSIEFPPRFPGFDHKLTIKDEIKVNIGEGFYNLMEKSDLTVFTMTWHYKAVGYTLYTNKKATDTYKTHSCANIQLKQEPLKPGWNDPDSPNFDPTQPGGTDNSTGADDKDNNNISWFEKFFNWLKGIFNFNISYKTFQRICIITVAVIIALIILSFIFKRKK